MFNDDELNQIKKDALKNEKAFQAEVEAKNNKIFMFQERKQQSYNLAYQGLEEFPKYIKKIGLEPLNQPSNMWLVFSWQVEDRCTRKYYMKKNGRYYRHDGVGLWDEKISKIADDMSDISEIINNTDIEQMIHNVFASALRGTPLVLHGWIFITPNGEVISVK